MSPASHRALGGRMLFAIVSKFVVPAYFFILVIASVLPLPSPALAAAKSRVWPTSEGKEIFPDPAEN